MSNSSKIQDSWKPIESAPKDGTNILVHDIYGKRYITHWMKEQEGFYAGHDRYGAHIASSGAFTHWTELP